MAVLLITAAVLFSVARAVLPYATGYKNEIQQEVFTRIGLPVEIESIDAAIHWFSPRLRLIGIVIYDKRHKVPLFNFKEAFIELDVIASLFHRELIINDVGLVGADISIEKLADNEWLVQGIRVTSEGSNELPEQFIYFLQNSDYLLHDSNIYYQDHTGKKLNISLLDINIDVKNHFNSHDIRISIHLPEAYGESLAVVANLHGDMDSLDGDVYIEGNQINVKQWNTRFDLLKGYDIDALVDIGLWVKLADSTVQTLTTQVNTLNLQVYNRDADKSWKTDHLSVGVRYVYDREFRNIAVYNLTFGQQGNPEWLHPANIIFNEDSEYFYLSADYLPLAKLYDMAEVFMEQGRFGDLDRLMTYGLRADIYNLNLHLPKHLSGEELIDKLYLDTEVTDLAVDYAVSGRNISVAGIDGTLHYADGYAIIDLKSEDSSVNIPAMFDSPLRTKKIQGKLELSHDADRWLLTSDRLQLMNEHVNSFSRLDIQLPRDGRVFVDLQTDFYDAYGKYARHYLPVGIMKPGLVHWLEMAVTDGYVPDGSLVLHGNLADFPFREHNGVFEVYFPVRDASMKFLEGWPPLAEASAMVRFRNATLGVSDIRAKSRGAVVTAGHLEIADLSSPHLSINSTAHGSNEDIQSYIWHSPLDSILGGAMRQVQVDGNSDLNLNIEADISNAHHDIVIDGHLNLINSEIYYPALSYELKDINGVIDFTMNSVFADALTAKIQNKPVSINAFTRESKSGSEVVFHLDGNISPDYILQHFERIPEDWFTGQSLWSVNFIVPYHPKDYLMQIEASSSLQGMILQVSDQLEKPAARKTDFSAELDVLENNGVHLVATADADVDIAGGVKGSGSTSSGKNLFKLYANRDEKSVWSFNIFSEYMTGKGQFTEGLGKDTLVKLELENIDISSMFYRENSKQSESVKPGELPSFDWKFKKAQWKDWAFTDVNVETAWHKHGMLINRFSLLGPAMKLDANGTWLTTWRGLHETVLQGNVSGDNLGEALTGLGFQRSLDRCDYTAKFNLVWPAEPYDLTWDNIKGDTSFEMSDGEIVDVDPGAGGRLLGLLNIFKLTNRLVFDFDDITREGFSFDTIKGEFEFDNGYGSLKKFDVSAPAADINMFGGIGLHARNYELLMRVKPHTDSLTFASGTLLGGVVIGAGLALIQKVFDLGFIGHNVYSITGSWDNPVIEKIIERKTEPEKAATDENDF